MHEDLVAGGARVVGISPQSATSHRAFREKYDLPFPLLVDDEKRVARAYKALLPLGVGFRRISYLVNKDQVIADAIESNLGIDKHLEWLKAFRGSSP
jgi:peroxiredoxin Q/BCP